MTKPETDPSQLQKYADMQKAQYERGGATVPLSVVGSYDYHENVPYETFLLYRYGDIRKPVFEDFSQRKAIDIGCGEGRMVRRMRDIFGKVDGVDISASMLQLARSKTPGSDFFETSGLDCGDAPSDHYDFAYCTISLQHISVFETRDQILRSVLRTLKADGKATFQYVYSKEYPYVPFGRMYALGMVGLQIWRRDTRHARWFDNRTDAQSTNGDCNVMFGERDFDAVRAYFRRYFEDVEIWFHDISIGRGGFGADRILPETHPNSHLTNKTEKATNFAFIHCSGPKGQTA
jgi:ubiquinone/menaquinone biosynthesis C-methylase UbiE